MGPPPGGKTRSAGQSIMVGGLAGGIEIMITYPTEFVKTEMQLYNEKAKLGPIGCVKHTIKHHGFFGMYRGLSSLLVFSVPKAAARFFAYDQLKARMEVDGKLSRTGSLACGLGAGVFEACVAVTPMETIKVKFIHDQLSSAPGQRKYKNLPHGIYTIVKEQGIAGTYKGLGPTIIKQGSNQAIRWLVYNDIKQFFAGPDGDPSKLSVAYTALAGCIAGAASVFGNTPIDVIKTKMQGLEAHKYTGMIDCIKQTFAEQGIKGFYRGTVPRLTRVTADVAIVMVLYEEINKLVDKYYSS